MTESQRIIALLVPVTSRGRDLRAVADADFFRVLLPSFVDTATWNPQLRYRVYLGYDVGDPFYDSGRCLREAARIFRDRVGSRRPVELILHASSETEDAPCAVWNALFRRAHAEGADFFYQLGDDVVLETPGWARDFPAALLLNPVLPGLGVTGPMDRNSPWFGTLTQSFVSRVHMDVFGTYYPPVFKNWWSDDWITDVYAPAHLRRWTSHVAHNRGGEQRYRIDYAGEQRLEAEVVRGRAALAEWLARPRIDAQRRRRSVIAFSLWGREPRYLVGAIRNAELAQRLYPGWTCRFYVGTSVPVNIIMRLTAMPNTELIGMREIGDWRGLFWRFLAASDEHIDVLLVRDADSRLSERERDAVAAWLASEKDFHIMRDHPFHNTAIMAGMFGVRRGLLWNMRGLVASFPAAHRRPTDQDFLRERVYPLVRDHALVHDEVIDGRPFPTPRRGLEFVGQIFDEHDRPLHEEHVAALAAAIRSAGSDRRQQP